jgi:hypothetical protein
MVMIRKIRKADLDDEGDTAPNDVARDGEHVRCPMQFMDGLQGAVALGGVDLRDHAPGYRSSSDQLVSDAQRAARLARQTWIKDISSAWKRPARDVGAEPDAANELLRRHLRTEPDDDAQSRREKIYNDYKTRLTEAWRTDPRAATAIERQRELWTAER